MDKKDLTGYFPAVISTIFSAIKVAKTIYDNFLCVRLYCWGFTHRKYKVEAYDVSSNWKNLLVKRMKGSKAVGDYLKEQIKLMNRGNKKTRSCDVVISFYNYIKSSVSDLDLTLAVGAGGSFKFNITKTNEKKNGKTYYKITAKLIDEVFNFEYWKINIGKKQFGTDNPHSSSKLVTIINNTGYFTQKCGAFIPFTWKFAVSYKILY
ncbi:MAG: hypothetical protein E7556_08655 [Ruminococcaceae bacterium]|nr:hypothetical protein [Oscillospiraceae bacterium]